MISSVYTGVTGARKELSVLSQAWLRVHSRASRHGFEKYQCEEKRQKEKGQLNLLVFS